MLLRCADKQLDLSTPQVMGILNVTPDSFSDGGQHNRLADALAQAKRMVEQGATIIDIGGESTRPGAADVNVDDELARTIPVIAAIKQQLDVIVSIDTSKAKVMTEAVAAGAGIINDVRALQEPGALEAAAATNAAICLMHMQGQPRTMQQQPRYADLFAEVNQFFAQRITACNQIGIDSSRLLLDPGFGFGKTLEHNFQLLAQLQKLRSHRLPLLIGLSRKSMIGTLLNRSVEQRVVGSVAGALLAAQQGAEILRVHDVAETVDALTVWQQVQRYGN
ncbi:dihydropteroate synthase [Ferrimonas lipolytica]|uniref:Dihydropteroate synthase n=1 Tax=Ferrimonas lipolytica TaxID=2724191 RepID=A0A6H1UA49_9GAMM|nr:dihydropteroate synthase [Ferrimonas lipolytica]QIZ75921.1 dihydropteroate synthase [Ferrimonas lipolytica]